VDFEVTGPIVEWRGPAPYWFLDIPAADSDDLKDAARGLEYWGQVAVEVRINTTEFTTALFPKDGRYLLPIRVSVRRAAAVDLGDIVTAQLSLVDRRPA
jgi:hypothetical protein